MLSCGGSKDSNKDNPSQSAVPNDACSCYQEVLNELEAINKLSDEELKNKYSDGLSFKKEMGSLKSKCEQFMPALKGKYKNESEFEADCKYYVNAGELLVSLGRRLTN